MAVAFRTYEGTPLYTGGYLRVRDFLARINREKLICPNFHWGRWEWMIGHTMLDPSKLDQIGIWEEDGKIVALATYEGKPGDGYFCVGEGYEALKEEMLAYASENLSMDGKFRALIDNNDREFQRVARKLGYRPTQGREHTAAIDIDATLSYALPEGFSVTSMAEGWDYEQYNRCMWRGFNHAGPVPQTKEMLDGRRQMLSGPGVLPELVVAVVSPEGDYVSHCGMWYRPGDLCALVEPVATDPDYRKMGLGRAAVLEAVLRCGKLGAKQAIVGSSQQFYYSIGFAPIRTETWWERPNRPQTA